MLTMQQCKGPEQVLQQAAIYLNTVFYAHKDKPLLFLTSGGSALKALDFINTSIIGENVTLSVLDERFSADPAVNNFAQLMALPFYSSAIASGAKSMDTRMQPGDTLAGAAQRWEGQIKAWITANPQGQIVATLGIGPDGHTSGIMPYPEAPEIFESLFCQPECWVVSYQAIGKNPYPDRITTTISFLKDKINVGVAIVSGQEKKEALQRVMATEGSLTQTPARVIKEMRSGMLYTDIT